MKPEIQVLDNFIQLIKKQSDLFSEKDRNELEAIITPLSNDDVEGLADEIDNWCTSHPVIDDALNTRLASQPIGEKGPGGTVPDAQTQAEYEKNLRETLINALRRSSPPENPQLPTPKG